MATYSKAGPALWVPGDWNGFFGLFTNVVLNVIVLTTLCLFVVQLPADTVYGRILPALGIALPIGNLYYAYLAYRLAQREGRSDVTAMPYGPSVPHMFIVVFVVMLPTYLKTKDPLLAWTAGLGWSDYMKGAEVVQALGQFGLHLPRPSLEVLSALGDVAPLLATAVPLGIYNFTEGINNVESAAAAGDDYNLRHILIADGVGALV